MILENDVEFAVGYSEPNAGSDAASMKLKAERHTEGDADGVAAQRAEDVDHVGPLRRVVLAGHADRSRQQAPRHHPHAGAARPSRRRDPRHLDDGRRAHQRGLHRQRVRPRRVRRRPGQQRLPVHQPGARPRALHDVHLLPDQAAPRRAHRLRAHRATRRRAAQGRSGRAVAAGPAAHRRRGGPGDGPQGRGRVGQGRARDQGDRPTGQAADGRVVGVQAVRHRVLASAWPTRRWTSAGPAPSCGCTPRTRR